MYTLPFELHQTFGLISLRMHCAAPKELHLSPNFLRGKFGKTLREIDRYAYQRWFEPRSLCGPSGLRDSPRAFVIRSEDKRIAPGERFEFGFNLFDLSASGVELAIEAFGHIVRIESVGGREALEFSLDKQREASRAKVKFVTPTELKGSDRPEFGILFSRLRDRISTLRALYQGSPLEIDFNAMAERAAAIKMKRCEIRQVESERVSRRTGQRHSLGGFVGFVEYEGDLGEFLPYLEIGRYTGVGRQTVWGKGEIHAIVA